MTETDKLVKLLREGHETVRNITLPYDQKDTGTIRCAWLNQVRILLREIGSPLADDG